MDTPKRGSFVFAQEWIESLRDCDEQVSLAVMKAIIMYALYGVRIELKAHANARFLMIKPYIDRNLARFDGWLRAVDEADKAPIYPSTNPAAAQEVSDTKCSEMHISIDNNILDNNINIESKEKEKEKEKRRAAFVPPTVAEVEAYIKEREIRTFTAETFCNYYASNGWQVGRAKMRDWRAAVRNWNARRLDEIKATQSNNQINRYGTVQQPPHAAAATSLGLTSRDGRTAEQRLAGAAAIIARLTSEDGGTPVTPF